MVCGVVEVDFVVGGEEISLVVWGVWFGLLRCFRREVICVGLWDEGWVFWYMEFSWG